VGDVIDIQYHVDYPGVDPMNQNDPVSASTRAFCYGLPQVPYAILNGGVTSAHRYDFSNPASSIEAGQVKLACLQKPEVNLSLGVNWQETGIEVSTEIECVQEEYSEQLQLYHAVIESSVTSYTGINGDTEFRNVVLDMLPSPAGKLLDSQWKKDSTIVIDHTWEYADYVEDVDELAVVAFLQNRTTGEIINAAVEYRTGITSVKAPVTGPDLRVYPNPASHFFYLNLGTTSQRKGRLEMLDMNGRKVLVEQLPAGHQVYQVGIDHLERGMNIIGWYESGQLMGIRKIIKID
jgi:hypothetical protein